MEHIWNSFTKFYFHPKEFRGKSTKCDQVSTKLFQPDMYRLVLEPSFYGF
jgi:hypothetical protein